MRTTTVRNHTHVMTRPTLSADVLGCEWSGCQVTMRVSENPVPAVVGSATSEAAARSLSPSRRADARQAVLDAIVAAGREGLTDEKGIEITGLDPNTYRPRRVELVSSQHVIDSHRTRMTKSGRQAVAWVAR